MKKSYTCTTRHEVREIDAGWKIGHFYTYIIMMQGLKTVVLKEYTQFS